MAADDKVVQLVSARTAKPPDQNRMLSLEGLDPVFADMLERMATRLRGASIGAVGMVVHILEHDPPESMLVADCDGDQVLLVGAIEALKLATMQDLAGVTLHPDSPKAG